MSLYNLESDPEGGTSADGSTLSRGGQLMAASTSSSSSASNASFSGDAEKLSCLILTTQKLAHWIQKYDQMDIGNSCNTVWTVSSAKHGNGVHHLIRHHDLNNFWQSDGMLPHVISIQLGQLTAVEAMAVYVNSAVDQSYSPRFIRVKAGTHTGDMTEVTTVDIGAGQVCGWVLIKLCEKTADEDLQKIEHKHASRGIGADVPPEQTQGEEEEYTSPLNSGTPGGIPSSGASSPPPPIQYSEVLRVLGHGRHAATAAPTSPLHRSSSPTARTQMSAVTPVNARNTGSAADRWLWCTLIDVCVCENQFNGRDCHLRGIRLLGPRYEEIQRVSNADASIMTSSRPLRSHGGFGGTADALQLR